MLIEGLFEYDPLTVFETESVLLTDTVTLADVDPLPDKAGVDDTQVVPLTDPHVVADDETDCVLLTVKQLLADRHADAEGQRVFEALIDGEGLAE
jgi:hypothetical protein